MSNKTLVLTGSSGQIGRSILKKFANENLACKAKFSMVLPSELNKFKIK